MRVCKHVQHFIYTIICIADPNAHIRTHTILLLCKDTRTNAFTHKHAHTYTQALLRQLLFLFFTGFSPSQYLQQCYSPLSLSTHSIIQLLLVHARVPIPFVVVVLVVVYAVLNYHRKLPSMTLAVLGSFRFSAAVLGFYERMCEYNLLFFVFALKTSIHTNTSPKSRKEIASTIHRHNYSHIQNSIYAYMYNLCKCAYE